MRLPTRQLGTSDLHLTLVGVGTWGMGGTSGHGWGAQDDSRSVATIQRAADLGINWVDTAAVYGFGHAEEVVGRALAPMAEADRPMVFTKCGLVPGPGRGGVVSSLSPAVIRKECEASLRRLRTERVDVLHLHFPDETGVVLEDSWATMLELVVEGKVRVPAVSNFDVDDLARCESIGHIGCSQTPLSLIRRASALGIAPWCVANGVGMLAYSPLQSGLLAGEFDEQKVRALSPDDWRRGAELFRPPHFDRIMDLVARLKPIAVGIGLSVGALALAWVLRWPGVTAAIVGARQPEYVEDWLPAVTTELEDSVCWAIAEAIERSGAGAGPMFPEARKLDR